MLPDTDGLNQLNPYLLGPYAHVENEITAVDLEVTGEIPRDFAGAYYRNGPNPLHEPTGMHHWFDGDGMLHAIHFEDGKAEYRNRYIQTADFLAEKNGTLNKPGIFDPAVVDERRTVYKDTANTDIVMHDGELLALWYISGQPVRLDPRTLETIRTETFDGKLPNNVSAHSKVDQSTGEFLFFDYALYEPWYSFGIVDKDNRLAHFTQIEMPGPRLPHDMAITENYAILMDLPVVFTEQGLRNKLWTIHQDPGLPTRFGVLPRHGEGADIRWFEFPGCYIYHVVNAWEEGDNVVLYCCKMIDNGRDLPRHYGPYAPMVNVLALRAVLTKWTMNLRTGESREEQVDDSISEFPAVNLGLVGRKTRYAYHASIPDTETQVFDGILKYDLTDGSHVMHRFEEHFYGSEPAFAPRLDAADEDDGYVITFVSNARTGESRALILDARNLADEPVAQVHIPQRIPLGFHGTWANMSEFRPAA
ncbi:MAG: 9-cis-epoxycarotenoid dioxygenase [Woeseiaceae bacterium]|nr:9-cis-epoxycarotenoid dioxygenase [Woeseiaceae bacterium]